MPAGPAYRILTDRLVLRPWNPEDAAELLEVILADLDLLVPWLPWAGRYPMTVEIGRASCRE